MAVRQWVKLPTQWIKEGGLKNFRWEQTAGANNIAALMTLMVIAHHTDETTGLANITYDQFEVATGLSRAKLAQGLSILQAQKIIDRTVVGRSAFRLTEYGQPGWGKLAAKPLYHNDAIAALRDFHLRAKVELNALKLFYLIVERRNSKTNVANISYDKIHEYTAIERNQIRAAASLLINIGLLNVDRVVSHINEYAMSNVYRLKHIDSYNHGGTTGRADELVDFKSDVAPF